MGPGDITFEQYPIDVGDKLPVMSNANPVIGYMVLQNDIEDLYYFKLILEVYTGTSVVAANLIGKMKQRRNGYTSDVSNDRARAYFDLRGIVNTVLINTVWDQNLDGQPFSSIHTLGANENPDHIFSVNGDSRIGKVQISSIYVKAYQEYSISSATSPEEDDTPSVNNTLYWLQASAPLFTPRHDDADFLQSDFFLKYVLSTSSGSTKQFLSDVQESTAEYNLGAVRRNYVQETDYHTLAMLNGVDEFGSDPRYIAVKFYDSDGNGIISPEGVYVEYISNVEASGGWNPDTTAGKEDKHRLLYLGCGPANLEAQEEEPLAKPSEYDDWAYYTIQARDQAVETVKSTLYYFIKQDGSCKDFKVRRLGWRNSVGCYDYWNFNMKSTQTVNVTRNSYNSILGRFDGSKFSYNDTQRGKRTNQTTAVLKETLQSDWITEQDANLMEKLIYSTDVYVIESSDPTDTTYTEGVIVTNSSFVRKTKANNKMIKYTINIEYANPINTNS